MFDTHSDSISTACEWIGEIPSHWMLLPNRAIFDEIINYGHPEALMLSVSISGGVLPQKDYLDNNTKKDTSRIEKDMYKLVQPGDIVYNKMRAWQGAIGISDYCGIVSPAYVVQRPNRKVKAEYLNYLLRTPNFAFEAGRWSYGIVSDMWSLRPEHFKMIYICVPPLKDQNVIVKYLDSADQMLRGGVSQKQRLGELMEEYKRAVIQQAVTRGLDPDVPLKPSGVEWLGDIPEHWEVRRLKDWVSINETVLPETTDSNYRFNYIDIGSVATGKLLSDPVILSFSDAPSRARRVIKTGDTIFSTVRTYLKAVWFAEFVNSDLICSTGFAVLTPQKDAVGKFVSYLVQSSSFTDMITSESVGIAYPAIAEGNLGSFYVPVPPVEEQTAIVAYLDRLTSDIDAAIADTRREIELLEEYRTRLIADVVTGKLDVREAAANLPDVSPDDLQPLAEGSEAGD